MTYDEFEKKYLGKAVDYDGVFGVQCVDIADQYLKDCFGITGVWCVGAKDLYNNFENYAPLVSAFEKLPNTRELVVRKGDLVVWNGDCGHIAIGTGDGTIDWFKSLEENTLGCHEPVQIVKHDFSGVLGVLRPKNTPGGSSSPLDTEIWYRKGDKDKSGEHGIYCIKQRLKAIGYKVDDTGGFGGGTEHAVRDLQRIWGYKQTGEIGQNFVKRLME